MQLFYTPDILTDAYTLSPEESRHAVQVLRLGTGDVVNLIDGRGGLYTARIAEPSTKGCTVQVTEHLIEFGKKPYELHIAIAPTKNIDRTEWFMEKATEMGIDRITPLLCDRSERKAIKRDRCEKVVLSAAKQSLKAYVPQVDELIRFSDFIKQEFIGYEKYIAHCDTNFQRMELSQELVPSAKYLILIGAEGDFSPSEIERAAQTGFRGISLGTSRLRTETAALMATAIASIRNQN